MRKPVIAANWKMNKTHLEGVSFIEELRNRLDPNAYDKVEVVVCPPFTALRSVQTVVEGDDLEIAIGAQNMYWETKGAYTGEVSPPMLTKLGVRYVIIGHSERREHFKETDEDVNLKVRSAFENGLIPIMCVGETLRERESGFTEAKVSSQVWEGLKEVAADDVARMVIAYEPIWAIGTGRNATAEDAQMTISSIRELVSEMAGGDAATRLRIQYGGSVNRGNIVEMMAQEDIDGALVGGASLDSDEFAHIVQYYKPRD
ncbi:MAG: triose-phosphate isomerase [Actinomycetota bacterium]|nr:triose-phosphate isomerase [Actinomycetota bacterium]